MPMIARGTGGSEFKPQSFLGKNAVLLGFQVSSSGVTLSVSAPLRAGAGGVRRATLPSCAHPITAHSTLPAAGHHESRPEQRSPPPRVVQSVFALGGARYFSPPE